jgi:sortase (surface protein transpeptidase)
VRPAVTTTVLGITLAVVAPTTWALTRPEAAAGAPVEQVLPSPSPSVSPSPATPTAPASPVVTARPAAPSPAQQAPAPVRVTVPGLGIDSPVDAVGVEPDGRMSLPADVDRVGWYRFGPAPGAAGSAVLAGHVDDREQGLGALAPLREVEAGAEVVVTDATGTATRWRVVSREVIEKQALPLDRLFAREGPPRLTLITCGGPFLPEFGSYRDNVVVVAEPLP